MLRLALLLTAVVAALSAAPTAHGGPAPGLPAAGADVLPLVAVVDAVTPLGEERVALTGWGRVEREAPRLEGGVESTRIAARW